MTTPTPLRSIDMNAVRAAHAAFEAKCEASLVTGQKLFARIRESSKYFGQSDAGQIFPVVVTSQKEYTVVGGPGGQYRLRDVDLFVSFEEGAAPIQITFEA